MCIRDRNNVPSRVQRILKVTKGRTTIQTFAFGGAQLSSFAARPDVSTALKQTKWDVVVLQEASISFMTSKGRKRFLRAVDWFTRNAPASARIVLYQTWPWQAGSRYLTGQPLNSAQMWVAMKRAYADVAERPDLTIAPVGLCWMRSPKRRTFYSSDGIHASLAGSRLAASIIARTITADGPVDC